MPINIFGSKINNNFYKSNTINNLTLEITAGKSGSTESSSEMTQN